MVFEDIVDFRLFILVFFIVKDEYFIWFLRRLEWLRFFGEGDF